jgi:hypothetical protein
MKMLLLTITSTTCKTDLELPAEVPLASIFPTLIQLCVKDRNIPIYPSEWSLWDEETHAYLDPRRSLQEADIVDGAILYLRLWREQESPRTFQPEIIPPGEESGGIGVRWNLPR